MMSDKQLFDMDEAMDILIEISAAMMLLLMDLPCSLADVIDEGLLADYENLMEQLEES